MKHDPKQCQHCGSSFSKTSKHTHAEWAVRKFCSQTCSNRSKGDASKALWADRLFDYVAFGAPAHCWIWFGYADAHGYGRLSVGGRAGKPRLAHRLMYEICRGAPHPSLSVRHRCDNPQCVNPAHLELGTHAENMNDFVKRSHGNRGSGNGMSKESVLAREAS